MTTEPPVDPQRSPETEQKLARRGRAILLASGALGAIGLGAIALGALQMVAASTARDEATRAASGVARLRGQTARLVNSAEEASREADRLEDSASEVEEGAADLVLSVAASLRRYDGMIDDFNAATDAHNAGNASDARAIIEGPVDAAIDDVAATLERERDRLAQMRAAMAQMARARRA